MSQKVLFVCLGNICRSPMAEGVFGHKVIEAGLDTQIQVDSAGTGSWHIGALPDERSRDVLLTKGIDISDQRARKVQSGDFNEFDYILAMDKSNRNNLLKMSDGIYHSKIKLFLEYSEGGNIKEVPDPYYGGEDGFHHIYELINDASEGLLRDIRGKIP